MSNLYVYIYILKLKPAQSHNISGLFHGMDPSPKVHGFYQPKTTTLEIHMINFCFNIYGLY